MIPQRRQNPAKECGPRGKGKGMLIHTRSGLSEKKSPSTQQDCLSPGDQRFQALVETTSDWVWEVDCQGRYTYASPKIRDLLGYAPEEVLGRTRFDFMPSEEVARVTRLFIRFASSREPFLDLENVNLRKDGRRVLLETSGVPVIDSKGDFQGYLGIDATLPIAGRSKRPYDRPSSTTAGCWKPAPTHWSR
jgi:PAS domain S-box-containing protein